MSVIVISTVNSEFTPPKQSSLSLLARASSFVYYSGRMCFHTSAIPSFVHCWWTQAPSSAQWSNWKCLHITFRFRIRFVWIMHSLPLVCNYRSVWIAPSFFLSCSFWGWSLRWCQIFRPSCSCCRDSQLWDLRPTALWLPVRTITDLPWRFSQLLWLQAIFSAIRKLK